MRSQNGITLVELMVALAIGALLFNFAFNIYLSSWRMYKRGIAAVRLNSEARLAVGSFARDIESSLSSSMGGPQQFRGEDKELKDSAGLPIRADSLSLMVPLSESHLRQTEGASPYTGLMRVDYFLDYNEAIGRGSLKKNIYLLRAEGWVEDRSVTLSENVKEVDFKYFDGARWVGKWDAESSPKAVELNIVLRDESNTLAPREISTIVAVTAGGR